NCCGVSGFDLAWGGGLYRGFFAQIAGGLYGRVHGAGKRGKPEERDSRGGDPGWGYAPGRGAYERISRTTAVRAAAGGRRDTVCGGGRPRAGGGWRARTRGGGVGGVA